MRAASRASTLDSGCLAASTPEDADAVPFLLDELDEQCHWRFEDETVWTKYKLLRCFPRPHYVTMLSRLHFLDQCGDLEL